MENVDGFALVDYIKTSIEVLMNMKVEEQDEMENPELFSPRPNQINDQDSSQMGNHLEGVGLRTPPGRGKGKINGFLERKLGRSREVHPDASKQLSVGDHKINKQLNQKKGRAGLLDLQNPLGSNNKNDDEQEQVLVALPKMESIE